MMLTAIVAVGRNVTPAIHADAHAQQVVLV
jgi:hypothetical protein